MAPMLPPLAHHTLCLLLEFDLRPVEERAALPSRDHAAVASRVCAETELVSGEKVAARGREVPAADAASVQQLPFDDWCLSPEAPVKLDFCYALGGEVPRLGLRILTDLRVLDGVTATRVALHVLEGLELGEELELNSRAFSRNRTFMQSFRQLRNVVFALLWVLLDLILAPWRLLLKLLACRPVEPNCPEGWLWYYREKKHRPADIVLYGPEGSGQEGGGSTNRFKQFMSGVEAWRQELGLSMGFFFLINYAPAVSVGLVRRAEQLSDTKARQQHAFGPPGQPRVGAALHFVYLLLHRRAMFNNYGRHTHGFKAEATAFCWDWLNFPATLSCAFAITVNGRLLCGIRGVRDFVRRGDGLLAESLGAGRCLAQITHHPEQGWSGVPPGSAEREEEARDGGDDHTAAPEEEVV